MKGGENMLKIMNPYQKQAIDNESVAFRDFGLLGYCMCNRQLDNYAATRDQGTGCYCSCVGDTNSAYNSHYAAYPS